MKFGFLAHAYVVYIGEKTRIICKLNLLLLLAANKLTFVLFQFYRVKLMREERHRQYENGERKFKYAVPPKIGVYQW